MVKDRLLILGAGGHGRAVAEAAQLTGCWGEIAFVDDGFPGRSTSGGFQILDAIGNLHNWRVPLGSTIVAIGNQAVRVNLFEMLLSLGAIMASVVHPRAWVSNSAVIGEGSVIMAGAVVGAHARIGRGAVINANATVDHDAVLGDFAHLGVGVHLAGGVKIGERAWLQAGCCSGYGVTVPADANMVPGTSLMVEQG